eukprot:CAMPEP_0201689100 /NCGR_PEP_ID=MMETSP0578-20130828/2747_1 /ASSEMBLY_ACC=CAM_ASM_000663 /TAXON_ID=267565 /ORGANISM="Skeletonema grethea, Strain CCMP 1804" /LENGTH=357 /DNA_ID=CAMNT_0048173625 /DNA_START=1 /DNA_END=1074 /DNA_ORIENTATION=+
MIINVNSNTETQAAEAAVPVKNTSRVRRRPGHWTKDTRNNENESSSSHLSPTIIKAKKKNTNNTRRRRRRPAAVNNKKNNKKQQENKNDNVGCDDDSSSASTASVSLSSSDLSSCQEDQENIKRTTQQHQQRKSKTTTRRRNKKSTTQKSSSSPTEIIQIPAQLTPTEKSHYIALDAEMVGVGPHGIHSRLARITLANYDGECIYDTLVQVVETVTDYRTFVSGITPQDLAEGGSAIPFEECRSTVLELIRDKIVIGHGLKNDFRVLGVTHPWYLTRDTAKYEPFMKVDPTGEKEFVPKKLKVLAKDKLGLVIQEEGVPHCPLEDAVAALELYKKHRVKWEKVMSYKMERTKEITKC